MLFTRGNKLVPFLYLMSIPTIWNLPLLNPSRKMPSGKFVDSSQCPECFYLNKKKQSNPISWPFNPPPRSVSNANFASYPVLGSQSVAQHQHLQHHPKSWLEMQIMGPPQTYYWIRSSGLSFHKSSRRFWCRLQSENHCE